MGFEDGQSPGPVVKFALEILEAPVLLSSAIAVKATGSRLDNDMMWFESPAILASNICGGTESTRGAMSGYLSRALKSKR